MATSISAQPLSIDWPLSIATPNELRQANAYYVRGRALYRKGRLDGAIEELYTAVSVREDYPQAQMLLARVLVMAERSREAVATLRGLGNPHRSSARALKLFGWAYYRMNRLNDAEETLQAALSTASRPDAEIHYLLGLIRLRQADSADAMSQAKQSLAVRPRYPPAYRLLSDTYLLQGKERLAQRALQQQRALVRRPQAAREIQQRIVTLQSMVGARQESSPAVLPQIRSVPQPHYTEQARRNPVEGMVRLQVLFGSDGRVQQIFVQQGLGFGLDEESTRAAQKIEFTPGQLNGRPVSVWAKMVFRYQLSDLRQPERKKDAREAETKRIAQRTLQQTTKGE